MTTAAVEQLLYLFDQTFAGGWHSLLDNLQTVTPEEWRCVPPGGQRSIRDIVQHVGSCTIMYENHAFGDAALTWDDPLVQGMGNLEDVGAAVTWLRTVHERLRARIASLDDAELRRPRPTNWGELKETRWIITMMIQHDLYHAGEINHLRSVCRRDDRWQHERS